MPSFRGVGFLLFFNHVMSSCWDGYTRNEGKRETDYEKKEGEKKEQKNKRTQKKGTVESLS